jgi:hypothetical protein
MFILHLHHANSYRHNQAPGMSTLITNLLVTHTAAPPEHLSSKASWLREYVSGCCFEIYRVPIGGVFEGLTFSMVANIVYQETGSCLFALEFNPRDSGRNILLNPGDLVLPNPDAESLFGFIIAPNKFFSLVVACNDPACEIREQKFKLRNGYRNSAQHGTSCWPFLKKSVGKVGEAVQGLSPLPLYHGITIATIAINTTSVTAVVLPFITIDHRSRFMVIIIIWAFNVRLGYYGFFV